MGSGEFPSPHAISIPMRYAVLLRDLRLSVPVFDDRFNAHEFATIFGALKGLQVRMVKFEHNLDKIELGMNKLEHRIDSMEQHMEQLEKELDHEEDEEEMEDCPQLQHSGDHRRHYYIEDADAAARGSSNGTAKGRRQQQQQQQMLALVPL